MAARDGKDNRVTRAVSQAQGDDGSSHVGGDLASSSRPQALSYTEQIASLPPMQRWLNSGDDVHGRMLRNSGDTYASYTTHTRRMMTIIDDFDRELDQGKGTSRGRQRRQTGESSGGQRASQQSGGVGNEVGKTKADPPPVKPSKF